MNKKLIAFFSILSLFLSTPIIPVNAAAKAGAKCSKVGSKSVFGHGRQVAKWSIFALTATPRAGII